MKAMYYGAYIAAATLLAPAAGFAQFTMSGSPDAARAAGPAIPAPAAPGAVTAGASAAPALRSNCRVTSDSSTAADKSADTEIVTCTPDSSVTPSGSSSSP